MLLDGEGRDWEEYTMLKVSIRGWRCSSGVE
jgi:hypothetical protein